MLRQPVALLVSLIAAITLLGPDGPQQPAQHQPRPDDWARSECRDWRSHLGCTASGGSVRQIVNWGASRPAQCFFASRTAASFSITYRRLSSRSRGSLQVLL